MTCEEIFNQNKPGDRHYDLYASQWQSLNNLNVTESMEQEVESSQNSNVIESIKFIKALITLKKAYRKSCTKEMTEKAIKILECEGMNIDNKHKEKFYMLNKPYIKALHEKVEENLLMLSEKELLLKWYNNYNDLLRNGHQFLDKTQEQNLMSSEDSDISDLAVITKISTELNKIKETIFTIKMNENNILLDYWKQLRESRIATAETDLWSRQIIKGIRQKKDNFKIILSNQDNNSQQDIKNIDIKFESGIARDNMPTNTSENFPYIKEADKSDLIGETSEQ